MGLLEEQTARAEKVADVYMSTLRVRYLSTNYLMRLWYAWDGEHKVEGILIHIVQCELQYRGRILTEWYHELMCCTK